MQPSTAGCVVSRHWVQSSANRLDAVFVTPAAQPARAALLICHGIGEVVEKWLKVQVLLAGEGVASLVFDYSGYGRSSGHLQAKQFEQDAVAAFHFLESLAPGLPVSLLGFSLGSGIAASVMDQLPVQTLTLCSAYTSFREAAFRVGLPRRLAFLAPPIWPTAEILRTVTVPVLIMHSENDRLFPVQMALDLNAEAGPSASLVIAPRLAHDDPYYRPDHAYWSNVSAHIVATQGAAKPSSDKASTPAHLPR